MRMTVEHLLYDGEALDQVLTYGRNKCVRDFVAQWPDGCEVTEDTVKKCFELDIPFDFIALRCLRGDALREYVIDTALARADWIRAAEKEWVNYMDPSRQYWHAYDRASKAAYPAFAAVAAKAFVKVTRGR